MNKTLMALAVVGAAAVSAGAATVDSVVLSQQRGIDKTVRIAYTLSGVEELQDMTVILTREGRPVEIPDGALTGERYAVSGNGEHVLSLDPSFFPDDYVVALRAEVTCSPSSPVLDETLYKIFDLTSGSVTDVRRADIMNGGYGAYETSYSSVASGLSSALPNQFIWTGVTNYPGAKTTKLVMRKIPAGALKFRQPHVESDVPAQANVQLTQDYWMSVFEMTRGQMRAISDTIEQPEGDAYPACNIGCARILVSDGNPDYTSRPAFDPAKSTAKSTGVVPRLDWKFGKRYAFDLPTQAQWQYAFYAGAETVLYDGSTEGKTETRALRLGRLPGNAEYIDNGDGTVTSNLYVEVGSYLPNAWGLYDMLGNVREQTCDIFTYEQIEGGLLTTNNVDLVGFRDASSGLKYGRTGSLGADPVTGIKYTRYFVAGIGTDNEGTMQSKNAGNEWSGFRLVVRPVEEEE